MSALIEQIEFASAPELDSSISSYGADDDDDLTQKKSELKTSADLENHYHQIGALLLVAEASSFKVGIPWLPPTKRVRMLSAEMNQALGDYIRCNLSTIPTNVLQDYLDDLIKLKNDDKTANYLHIELTSLFERLFFAFFLTLTSFGICLTVSLFSVTEGYTQGVAWLLSLVVAAVVATASIPLCTDSSRRTSFHNLLSIEMRRRRGQGVHPLNKLPLCPIGNN